MGYGSNLLYLRIEYGVGDVPSLLPTPDSDFRVPLYRLVSQYFRGVVGDMSAGLGSSLVVVGKSIAKYTRGRGGVGFGFGFVMGYGCGCGYGFGLDVAQPRYKLLVEIP
ncbi:predicted protein [Sclerotinia sclerotiorum 1980 UF-70]|uniref:Uncharacterized protein n=1 Tax=Sclerotinia sclerotiorum (strain ATCC 18683 / 1980 / Ss-1) TaxID=665079 RepID=A7EBW2_SCLS1|nr:predicted protein [Sclerotinia sclerotiorum 1980 UF-70]EDN99940.1 predicted protein [Sclerotinia sclerotiorum 1980 UF-70]